MTKQGLVFLRYRILFLTLLLCLPALLLAEDWIYRIRPGETLSAISTRYLLPEFSAAKLQAYNNIEKDRQIPIGTNIQIPLEWLLQSPAGAKIDFQRGNVELYRGGSQDSSSLRIDETLKLNDRIVTGTDAVVSIRFADGSRLLMGPQSEVILDTLSTFGETGMIDTRLRVQRGRVESRVLPLQGEGSRYEILTPAAVTMVRGTGFRISVEADTGLTRNEVTEGIVAVAAGGESVSVTAGFGTLVEPGKPPAAPTKLLPAPDLSALPAEVDSGALTYNWPPLDEAKRYRLKLQVSDEDGVVLQDVLTESASSTLDIQQPGTYQLSIRGIDESGLEGLTARHTLQVNLRPLLTSPDLSALPAAVEMGPVALQWQQLDGAESYRIKLYAAGDADSVLLDSKTNDPSYTLESLQPGEYQLTINAIDVYERAGASGQHQLLVYPPLLTSPDLSALPAAVEMGPLPLRWLPLDGAESYRIKLQTVGDTDSVFLDKQTDDSSYTLESLQPGGYQLTVNAIDAYDREGTSAQHRLLVYPPLLTSPDLSALPAAVDMGPLPLRWQPLDGAESYRIKLQTLGDTDSVFLDKQTDDPSYTLENLQPGNYQLTINAIDVYEREGANGQHQLLVYPPLLTSPDLSAFPAAVEMGPLPLRWLPLDGAESYRIKLQTVGDADSVLLDKQTDDPSYTLEGLQPANYQLTISGFDKYEREGANGQHRLLVYPPLLTSPDLSALPAAVEMGPLPLRWLPLEGAESYRIKLQAVGDADSVLLDIKTDDPAYLLENLQPGKYQLTINAIDVYEPAGTSGQHRLLVYPPLLTSPDLSALPAAVEMGPLPLRWLPLDGAESYRIKLQTEGDSDSVILDSKTDDPSYTLESLQPGKYQLTISGFDKYEREGANGQHRLLVYPPLLTSPDLSALQATVEMGPLPLRWLPLDGAESYRIKLQAVGDADSVLLDSKTDDPAYLLENLQPGKYQLTINAIDVYERAGTSGQHRLLVYPPLLTSPDLSALPAAVEMVPLPFQWASLDGAESYRIKLQMLGDADSVLLDSKTDDPSYTLESLQPGKYQLTISGFDKYEREGANGQHRLLVYPPLLTSPDLSALPAAVEMGPLPLRWLPLDGAESYRVKLLAEGDSDSVILDIKTDDPSYTLESLQPGKYQLTISGFDKYEREGTSGLHRLLVYPPLLTSPDLSALPAAVEMGPLPLRWLPLEGAESYRIKLQAVGDADSVLLDKQTDDPSYTLEGLQPANYQLTISGFDKYEREGANGQHRLLVYPPLLTSPDLSQIPEAVQEGPVTFKWPALDGAVSYRVQLRSVSEGDVVLHDLSMEDVTYSFEDLQPGAYQLSIMGIDDYGQEGLAGLQDLQINKKPRAAPLLVMPLFGPGWVDLSWSQVEDAWGYRLMIARDVSFKNPLFEHIGMASRFRLPFYWQGRLFVRVDALFETDPRESHSGVYRIELPWR